jgi:hypothetical protein
MPEEFLPCTGLTRLSTGLFAAEQSKQPFAFSYRTIVGNDTEGNDYGYKIHLVYNATAQSSTFARVSIGASSEAKTQSWDVAACPVTIPSRRPAAHVIFDTRLLSKTAITRIEDVLYGTDDDDPRLLTTEEIVSLQLIEDSLFSGGVDIKKPSIGGTTTNYLRVFLKKPKLSGTG